MKIMKLNTLETHDRLLEFQKQADYISQGLTDCINKRPEEFSEHPFYVFAHARTDDDGVTKRLIWQPRLTKPEAQSNSMLFKIYLPDNVKKIWMIPDEPLWDSFKPKKMTHDTFIWECIVNFLSNRNALECTENDDLPLERVRQIYMAISKNNQNKTKSMVIHDF